MNINFRGQRLIPGYDFLQSQNDNKPIKVLVHEFIQSVVFTPFPQDSELQIERLILAGNIYESIGFKRKAAFYRRFAALKSVTIQADWQACYDSLLGSLEGFGLTLDPVEYEYSLADRCSSVWPGLHLQLIEELITCCKKIQTNQAGTLAIRHMSFMLHTLDFYLSASKKRDTARDLDEASTIYGEDSPVPLKLNNGYVIPTVNLTKYPLCLKIDPLPLPLPLRPARLVSLRRRSTLTPTDHKAQGDNPFIFTPITNHSSMSVFETNLGAGGDSLMSDVMWVQDEPCTTIMSLMNTLPFELNVTSIKLLTDGVPLDARATGVKLEADPSRQVHVQLVGIPRHIQRTSDDSSAQLGLSRLEIFGYSTHLLGVKSNCRLDMMPKSRFSNQIVVEVCPPLPKIEFLLTSESPNLAVEHIPVDEVSKELVVLEAQLNLNIGHTFETSLTILNSSNVDLQYIFVKQRQPGKTRATSQKFIELDEEILERVSLCPLKSGCRLDVPMRVEASTTSSFEDVESVATLLEFEYSGGLALEEMLCRRCSIKMTINLGESKSDETELEGSEFTIKPLLTD